ncbi:MAG TPA: helix-turn-helix domain-containing protein [Ignavibacteriaceae bacterium]|nr:helix-turn-helix domain-containing protein [Ignavibacteriaceae bacterium]
MTIKQTKEFNLAFRFVTETNQNIFLTGKAGTGKTTFLKYLQHNSPKKIVVAAPTGVAAINARGVTLHSLFQLPFGIVLPNLPYQFNRAAFSCHPILSKIHYNKEKIILLRSMEVLVIDEASMLASYTLDAIDAVLKNIRRNDLPFGGVQVLFIGDLFQLPPVVKREEWEVLQNFYSSIFFFDSFILRNNIPVIIELKEIFRQKDDKFIEILNGIRNNNINEENFGLLNSRLKMNFVPQDHQGYITLTTHNYQSDEINKRKLRSLPGRIYTFYSEITGEFADNILPAEKELNLKIDAQVMFLKNDTEEKQYFNGKIGTITWLSDDKIKVKCKDDPYEIEVKKYEWQNISYTLNPDTGEISEEILGSFIQYPLRLAWAITIHKSQGLTFERVVIDAEKAFTTGQVYVALSRCTSLDGLVLISPVHKNFFGGHRDVNQWQERLLETNILNLFEKSREKYILNELQNIFTWDNLYYQIKDLNEFILENRIKISSESIGWISELMQKQNDLHNISERFRHEIKRLNKENLSIEKNDFLQKRIKDGAYYFYNEIDKIKTRLINHPVYTNTKKLSRKIDVYLQEISYSVHYILQRINFCKKGFLLDDYLKNKESFEGAAEKIRSSYSKIKLKAGLNTVEETVRIFREGKNIEEIAAVRNLVTGTIESHFAKAIKQNLIQIEEVMHKDEIEKILTLFPKDSDNIFLGPIKEKASPEISYGKLRMVLAWLEKKIG